MSEKIKIIDVDLTEEFAFSWPNPEIDGWRFYRIEYGGCNESCYYEGRIILPPEFDSWCMTELFEIIQVPKARRAFEKAVKKIHKRKVGKFSHWRCSRFSWYSIVLLRLQNWWRHR